MDLAPGIVLSQYRLVEKIGEGGMGVVWKATDTTLGREVALKFLPAGVSAIADRLERFGREAKMLAALNHPRVAAVYGLHHIENLHYLAMELVPGSDLAERLAVGPFSLDEAVRIAIDVAEALEAAHGNGVIHRDLKPANIRIGPDDRAKVLDFGLAKALAPDAASGSGSASLSPTLTSAGTMAGTILGTAAYMSPEQARGKPVDRRTDVWSFGCVLFELLTGRQAFGGETVSDAIARILQSEPDWRLLPGGIPASLRRLLNRCLQKDTDKRLRDMGDVRLELQDVMAGDADGSGMTGASSGAGQAFAADGSVLADAGIGSARAGAAGRRSSSVAPLAFSAVALLAGFGLGFLFTGFSPDEPATAPAAGITEPVEMSIVLPPEAPLAAGSFISPLAFSPDGSLLAYVGVVDGTRRLHLRPLDQDTVQALAGTDGAEAPVFSPDGQWIAFFADGALRKVSVRGGPVQKLLDLTETRGIDWGGDDVIALAPNQFGPIFTISAAGGTPELLSRLGDDPDVFSHRFPHFLPDGETVLYSEAFRGRDMDNTDTWIVPPHGAAKQIMSGGIDVKFVASGHLVYVRGNMIMGVPFDPDDPEIKQAGVPLNREVAGDRNTGAGHYALSRNGHLAYMPGDTGSVNQLLVLAQADGSFASVTPPADHIYRWPRISPDGNRIAVNHVTFGTGNLFIVEMATGKMRALVSDAIAGTWTPDGTQFLYTDIRGVENGNIFLMAADGSSPPVRLTDGAPQEYATSISPDGGTLAFTSMDPETGTDVHLLDLAESGESRPFLATEANEDAARFSPDGKWLAYMSDERDQPDIYVVAYPGPGGKWRISSEGGTHPVWSPEGDALYYRSGRKVMKVSVSLDGVFNPSPPVVLFNGAYEGIPGLAAVANYDVMPGNKGFIMLRPRSESEHVDRIQVVLNWSEELRRLVPTGGR